MDAIFCSATSIKLSVPAIALGSTAGGLLFDSTGYRSTFMASAAVLLFAAFLAFLTSRSQVRQAA
jgi:predicted MFS family arabinose efflux permease